MADRTRPCRAAEELGIDQEQAAFDQLLKAIDELAQSPAQAASLAVMVHALHRDQRHHHQRYRLAVAHVPLLVAHGLTGVPGAGVAAAAPALAIYIGVDALDDLVDGDVPKYWADPPSPVDVIACATLLGALGQLLVARVEGADRSVAMQRELGATLLAMSAGQAAELAGLGGVPGLDDVRRSVAAKSGAMLGGFAALGARLADAGDSEVQAARRYGSALGFARQISSDLSELLAPGDNADLRNGLTTVPLAYHLTTLSPSERQSFRERLAAASGDDALSAELVDEVAAGRGFAAAIVDAELHCGDAMQALDELAVNDEADHGLRQMISDASPLLG